MTAENRLEDPYFDADHVFRLALDDFHEAQETGDKDKFLVAGEIGRSAYRLYPEGNLNGKELSARISISSFLDAGEFAQAKLFGNEVLNQIGDKIHGIGLLDLQEKVEFAEVYNIREVGELEIKAEIIAIEADKLVGADADSLYLEAAEAYKQAYERLADDEVEYRIDLAEFTLECLLRARDFKGHAEFGEEFLKREGMELDGFRRRELIREIDLSLLFVSEFNV